MNMMTLIYVEFKHVQLHWHMAQLGVVKSYGLYRNTTFIALVAPFKHLEGKRMYISPHS